MNMRKNINLLNNEDLENGCCTKEKNIQITSRQSSFTWCLNDIPPCAMQGMWRNAPHASCLPELRNISWSSGFTSSRRIVRFVKKAAFRGLFSCYCAIKILAGFAQDYVTVRLPTKTCQVYDTDETAVYSHHLASLKNEYSFSIPWTRVTACGYG